MKLHLVNIRDTQLKYDSFMPLFLSGISQIEEFCKHA